MGDVIEFKKPSEDPPLYMPFWSIALCREPAKNRLHCRHLFGANPFKIMSARFLYLPDDLFVTFSGESKKDLDVFQDPESYHLEQVYKLRYHEHKGERFYSFNRFNEESIGAICYDLEHVLSMKAAPGGWVMLDMINYNALKEKSFLDKYLEVINPFLRS